MKRFKNITWLFLLFFIWGVSEAQSQNTMSPYSIFGPGEILSKGFGRNIGMGRTGLAVMSDNRLNNLNPASYSGIEKQHFIFEIGVDGKYSDFRSFDDNMNGFNGNLRYVAMGFRYTPWLATSIGLSPYSSVGYNISTQSSMEGTLLDYSSDFEGSGGITLAYWAHSLKLLDNLSLGLNTSFLFGPLTQQENLTQNNYGMNYTVVQNDYLSSFYFDFGLQYSFSFKKLDFSLGLIYAGEQSLRSKHTFTLTDSNLSPIYSDEENTNNIIIPETRGIGISIQNSGKYLLAVDYRTEKWAGLKYPTMSGNFMNAHSFSTGIEFRPWRESVTNVFYKNWAYRLGGNFNSSYLKLNNKVINEFALTAGIGLPLKGRESTMNIAIELGQNGTTQNGLLKERFLLLHLNFSINELWFIQKKFY
jgi:hypothetical protein